MAALGIALATAACADAVSPNPVGVWGGAHVRVDVRHDVTPGIASGGTVEFDCAHGSLAGWLDPDKSGRFDVLGVYVQDHGGPIRVDEPIFARPARYSGEINGSRMTLYVMRTDSAWSAGPFTLQRGATGPVFKCL